MFTKRDFLRMGDRVGAHRNHREWKPVAKTLISLYVYASIKDRYLSHWHLCSTGVVREAASGTCGLSTVSDDWWRGVAWLRLVCDTRRSEITSMMSLCHADWLVVECICVCPWEKETCWRKRGVSLVSGMIGGVV